jgi:hypothetical protein
LREADDHDGGKWRKAVPITLSNGKRSKLNGKQTFWSKHVCFYNYMHWQIDVCCKTEEEAIQSANAVTAHVQASRITKQKPWYKIKEAFDAELGRIEAANPGASFRYGKKTKKRKMNSDAAAMEAIQEMAHTDSI